MNKKILPGMLAFLAGGAIVLGTYGCLTTGTVEKPQVSVQEGQVQVVPSSSDDHTWSGEDFTVVYFAENGTGETRVQDFKYNVASNLMTLSELGFKNPVGKYFAGWTLAKDSNVINYTNGQKFLVPVDGALLFAVWKDKDPHEISYRNVTSKDGIRGGAKLEGKFLESRNVDLPVLENRVGYTFTGWYLDEECRGPRVDGWKAGTYETDLVFYAQWTGNVYNVSYNLNGGVQNPKAPSTHTYGQATELVEPQKRGCKFEGWYPSSNLNGSPLAQIGPESYTKDIQLWAKWSGNVYAVNYILNMPSDETYDVVNRATGGKKNDKSQEGLPQSHTFGKSTKVNSIKRVGYSFDGWYLDPEFRGQAVEELGAEDFTDAIALYAKWTGLEYSISYVMNGGNKGKETPEKHTYGVETKLVDPSRTGYAFKGWYTDSKFTNGPVSSIGPKDYTSGINLFAKWDGNVYSISYNLNNGKLPETYAKTHKYGTRTVLPKLEREGFKFGGWYRTADLKGAEITEIGEEEILGDIELWAKWRDSVAPGKVTGIRTESGHQQIKLSWKNPSDDDLEKVVVTYSGGDIEISAKEAGPGKQVVREVGGLEDGTRYSFAFRCYDLTGNVSEIALANEFAGNGGFVGLAQEEQGAVLGDIVIGEKKFEHTSQVVAVPMGTTAVICMLDDASWIGNMGPGAKDSSKGIFLKGQKKSIKPYSIGQHPVTQELYQAVMGTNPSQFIAETAEAGGSSQRPVETVNWYQAIAFCNKLTLASGMSAKDLVYSVEGITDWANLTYDKIPETSNEVWDRVKCDLSRTGYRLPTEEEWEFAAHGGNMNVDAWENAFSGTGTADGKKIFDGTKYLSQDANLGKYGWYTGDRPYKTHPVGLKGANSLGIYDMSGNVWEWCWDESEEADFAGTVAESANEEAGIHRVLRGGSWFSHASECTVTYRGSSYPYFRTAYYGFRVARTR